ncbi:hypothetical protein EC988_006249, partial [Linderina pennispora]
CIQNPDLLQIYNSIACQPSVPKHDNMARIGNPVLAEKIRGQRSYSSVLLEGLVKKTSPEQKRSSRPNTPSAEISGAPWLSCAWCHEYVHGRALICHACGHGGHQEHMLKWFKTVLQQIRKSGLSPAHIGGYSADALPVQHALSDNSAGASSAPSGLASRINTAGNTRTHTRNPTLSADVLPAVTISPAPESAVSVDMPSDAERDSDDGSSVDSTDQSSPNDSLLSVHEQLSFDSFAENMMTADMGSVATPDDLPCQPWALDLVDIPTCPAGCGCNCLLESRNVM